MKTPKVRAALWTVGTRQKENVAPLVLAEDGAALVPLRLRAVPPTMDSRQKGPGRGTHKSCRHLGGQKQREREASGEIHPPSQFSHCGQLRPYSHQQVGWGTHDSVSFRQPSPVCVRPGGHS